MQPQPSHFPQALASALSLFPPTLTEPSSAELGIGVAPVISATLGIGELSTAESEIIGDGLFKIVEIEGVALGFGVFVGLLE